jgi:hypothetical protein
MKRLPKSLAVSLAFPVLAGCYLVPVVDSQGNVQYDAYPLPPAGTPAVAAPAAYPRPYPGAPASVVLNARLYPDNEIAAQGGVITCTVISSPTGKGRFQLQYNGEVLTGEATRVSNDSRRGIAAAYGPSGTYMRCEYQMSSPRLGAGTCTFSNGARYTAQIGG